MSKKPLYIFDIDGTLADIQHRLHLKATSYTDFHAACVNDYPIQAITKLLDSLFMTGCEIWLFSGRSDAVRLQTINWLTTNTDLTHFFLSDGRLMMRPEGDKTKDSELKRQWLHNMLPEDRDRLVAVFEDRKRVVDMWRSEGVLCLQVAEGDF